MAHLGEESQSERAIIIVRRHTTPMSTLCNRHPGRAMQPYCRQSATQRDTVVARYDSAVDMVVISFLFVLGTKGRMQPVVMAPGRPIRRGSVLALLGLYTILRTSPSHAKPPKKEKKNPPHRRPSILSPLNHCPGFVLLH